MLLAVDREGDQGVGTGLAGQDVRELTTGHGEVGGVGLEAVLGFVSQFSGPGQEEARAGLFGPVVEVPDDAPLLDRVIGLTGRDPAWSPG